MLFQLAYKVAGPSFLKSQSGNMVLYLLLLTPISLTLGLLTVDILGWHALGSNLQLKADRIALAAAKLLPDTEAARRYIENELSESEFTQFQNRYELELDPSQVSLSLDAQLQTVLPLPAQPTETSTLFTQKRYAKALVSPVEIVVIAQDGESLRPQPFSIWEPSRGGSYRITKCLEGESDFDSCQQEWKTQNCLNPSFGELKLGLVKLISDIEKTPTHLTFILFWPGDNPSQGFSKFDYRENANSSFSQLYIQPRNNLSDRHCLDVAKNNANARTFLSAANNGRELSLLSRVIREGSTSTQQEDLEQIVNTAICQFSGLCQTNHQQVNANAKNLLKQRVLLVLTDNIPISPNSLVNVFDLLEKVRVKPIFLAWSHPAIGPEGKALLRNKIEFIRQLNPNAGFLANSSQELRNLLERVIYSDIQEVTLGR
jgi:hypothetical protein